MEAAPVAWLGWGLAAVLALLVVAGFGNLLLGLRKAPRPPQVRGGRARDAPARLGARRWDLFVSYKSESANAVRRVVERLMAAGYRIWFAEYQVLLTNYERFEREIRRGAADASYALLFTSGRFAASPHCAMECDWLGGALAGHPERLVELRLETPNDARAVFRLPAGSPSLPAGIAPSAREELDGDRELLARLATVVPIDPSRCSTTRFESGDSYEARCDPIVFDLGGFRASGWRAHAVDGTDEAAFVWPDRALTFELNARFDHSLQAAPGRPYTLVRGPVADDRELYQRLARERRSYASGFMRQMARRGLALSEDGLHLVWTGGRGHLGLTHHYRNLWMRKYSVILEELPRPTEVILTFAVKGSFGDFCRLTPIMDGVVESVRPAAGAAGARA